MKRILLILAFLCGAPLLSYAAPYSHIEEIAEVGAERFLAKKLLTQSAITYCVSIPEQKQKMLATEDELALMTESALREWTYGIALRIRQAGRANEFQDILSVLEKPLSLQRVSVCDLSKHPAISSVYPQLDPNGEKADLTILFAPQYCTQLKGEINSFFVFDYKDTTPFICLNGRHSNSVRPPQKDDYFPSLAQPKPENAPLSNKDLVFNSPSWFKRVAQGGYTAEEQAYFWRLNRLFEYDGHTFFDILVHETGHAFGLADEYLPSRPKRYASTEAGGGLMKDAYQTISCDEIDGMITLLDRFSGKQRTFKSFCEGRKRIKNGTEYDPLEDLALKHLIKHFQEVSSIKTPPAR